MRIVATPIDAPVDLPSERDGGVAPALLPAFHAHGLAEERLAQLADPATLAVTTGQQPGLFTGPLYTIYKALSAAALARRLERRWDRPVVPVFWSAGDDHDFAEVNHASWLDATGALHTGVLRERPAAAPLTPMYREALGPEVERVLSDLAAALPESEPGRSAMAWLERHYQADATVAGAYRDALAELLGPLGIVVFESTHPAAKAAARPHVLRALTGAAALDAALAGREAALAAAGTDPGVPVGDGATLVMLEAEQGRDRLLIEGSGYVTRRSGQRFTLGDLEAIAEREPERLSPNVLLRPAVESALLPTVAYVAGPGELRYLALTPPVYEQLGIPRQSPVPRWSGVLVEPAIDRVLGKLGLGVADVLAPGGGVERRLVREQLPSEAGAALAALRDALHRGYARLAEAAGTVDPTLVGFIEGMRNRALAGANDAETKLLRHLRRRQATELGQLGRARTALLPGGKPQERVLTIAPFLARHGTGLLTALLAEADRWYADALEGAAVGE